MRLSCLTANTVATLFANRLAPDEEHRVHAHADACARCRQVIAEVARGRQTDDADADAAEAPSVVDSVVDTDVRARHVVLGAGDQVSRYVIERFLGAGAMGAVYEARDPELGRRVALKLVAAGGDATTEGRAGRLVREAQAMARLSHPNIVQVFDAGRSGDVLFIAMQRIAGASLRTHLATTRESTARRLALMRDAGRGLAVAHAAGIVHRDLKPDNILVDDHGAALVGDFGLAVVPEDAADVDERASVAVSAWQTGTGAVLGTPAYMAPEVVQGARGDARADQYSFGVTLAEVVGPGAPRRVRAVVKRACAVDPGARFPSMAALLAALEPRVTPARVAVGVAVLAVAAFVAWPRASAEDAVASCRRAADERMHATWGGPARAAVAAHLTGLAAPGAAATSRTILGRVDRYADAWRAMRREACEATAARGEQTQGLHDLRMACLDERLGELAAVRGSLARVAPAGLAGAVGIDESLGDLAQCADARSLGRRAPRDPFALGLSRALAAELATANATLTQRRVAEATGGRGPDVAEARRVADAVLAAARAARLPVIEAQALRVRSYLEAAGRGAEDADGFYRALAIGDRLADPMIRADALLGLLAGAAADATRAGEVAMLARLIEAALAEMPGEQHARRGRLAGTVATAARDRGELAPAETGLREAVRHLDIAHGAGDPRVLNARRLLARVQVQRGRIAEARATIDEVIAAIRETYGDPHPMLAAAWTEAGRTLAEAGAYADARVALERALAMSEALHGPSHLLVAQVLRSLGFLRLLDDPAAARVAFARSVAILEAHPRKRADLAAALVGRGEAELAAGDPAAAVASLEAGFAIWAERRADRNLAPTAQFTLAQALWRTAGDRRRARALATEALATYRTTQGPWSATVDEVTREVSRWLETHR